MRIFPLSKARIICLSERQSEIGLTGALIENFDDNNLTPSAALYFKKRISFDAKSSPSSPLDGPLTASLTAMSMISLGSNAGTSFPLM